MFCFNLDLRNLSRVLIDALRHTLTPSGFVLRFLCSPNLKGDFETIERVQRRFTKRIPGFGKLTYGERLNRLSIPILLSCVVCVQTWYG